MAKNIAAPLLSTAAIFFVHLLNRQMACFP